MKLPVAYISRKKGFTLLELMLVLGILVLLIVGSLPLGINFYKSQQLDTHTQGIIQTLRRAQLKAMSIEADSEFGVHITNNNYTLFKGSTYNPDDPYNEATDLPAIITVTTNPVFSTVIFSKLEGLPSVTGAITLSCDDVSRTISINEVGRVNLE